MIKTYDEKTGWTTIKEAEILAFECVKRLSK